MNDFQERVIAAQDLRDECREYGIRLSVRSDGSVLLFHGTSAKNVEKILRDGFAAGTYFSHSKTVTGYGDEGPDWYANIKNKNGCVLEVRVDARCVEFVSSTGEFYCHNALKRDLESGLWSSVDKTLSDVGVDALIREATDRSDETTIKNEAAVNKEYDL